MPELFFWNLWLGNCGTVFLWVSSLGNGSMTHLEWHNAVPSVVQRAGALVTRLLTTSSPPPHSTNLVWYEPPERSVPSLCPRLFKTEQQKTSDYFFPMQTAPTNCPKEKSLDVIVTRWYRSESDDPAHVFHKHCQRGAKQWFMQTTFLTVSVKIPSGSLCRKSFTKTGTASEIYDAARTEVFATRSCVTIDACLFWSRSYTFGKVLFCCSAVKIRRLHIAS